MATEYKILGQAQGTTAPAQENINLYPDPNHERYTSEQNFDPHSGTASVVTAGAATNSIWYWQTPVSGGTSHAYQHWPLNGTSASGTTTSGRTGYVRFSNHENVGAHDLNHSRTWRLDTNKTGTLTAGKTYTLDLWAHAHVDSHNHGSQHGNSRLEYWDGAAWQYIIAGVPSDRASHLGDINNHGGAGVYQIQTDAAGNRQAWNAGWCRFYKTFTAAGSSKFDMRVALSVHSSNIWHRLYLDNVYLAEGAIPRALIPAKAPDGTSGNPLALHTTPFTTRSEGWSGEAYNSPTTRKFTGDWQNLYMVPDLQGASAVVSTITISNSGSSTATYRIAVQKFGETLANKHFIAFDHTITPTSLETLTIGMTLGRQDKIIVQSDSERIVFSAFGTENTL
jgi:hypothetical protein